jgi:hypothetical protein
LLFLVQNSIIPPEVELPAPRTNPYIPPGTFDIHDPRIDPVSLFRFTAEEIEILAGALGLPDEIRTEHGYITNGVEALAIVCHRLSYPRRLEDQIATFYRSRSAISSIFRDTLMFIDNTWGWLMDFRPERVRASYARYSAAIERRGSPIPNCIGFINGTVRRTCRPTPDMAQFPPNINRDTLQRAIYNGSISIFNNRPCLILSDLLPSSIISSYTI